ncbi:MAG: magnesium transporter [Solirubrobacteraceae bacterium]|jgi:magnesium transporter|nr:magnesium transporter [Solirubrobacteraceae bacterium]MEA2396074.1 magnesium transporter [Solirubrobacteraceae bacterium]
MGVRRAGPPTESASRLASVAPAEVAACTEYIAGVAPESPSWFPLPRREPARQGSRTAEDAANPPRDRSGRALSPEEVGSAVVDCGLYDAGERRGGRIELESALRQADACADGFAWIGLHDPSPAVIEAVGRHFELHPLAVEDAVHAHQRPKVELYGDSLFAVLKTARYRDTEETVDIGEVMVFVGANFVVTVRHGEASPLHDVRLDLEAHPDLLGIGPSAVLYAVCDRIVDDYAAVIDGIALDIEQVEADVFSEEHESQAERIYRLKREVVGFRRAATQLQAPMQRLASKQTGLPLDPRTGDYFRDVHDHLARDVDRIAGFDELLTGVLQANLAQLTVRDNQDMRRISAWVAILAVPTMIFGLYGMNFRYMPELDFRYGYPLVLAIMAVVCVLLYRRFKRSGWL